MVWPVGEFLKKVYINKKNCVHFTYLPKSSHGRICIQFGTWRHLSNIINCATFYLNQIRGFHSVGSSCWLSHRNEMSSLTQGLNYSPACDRKLRRIYVIAAPTSAVGGPAKEVTFFHTRLMAIDDHTSLAHSSCAVYVSTTSARSATDHRHRCAIRATRLSFRRTTTLEVRAVIGHFQINAVSWKWAYYR